MRVFSMKLLYLLLLLSLSAGACSGENEDAMPHDTFRVPEDSAIEKSETEEDKPAGVDQEDIIAGNVEHLITPEMKMCRIQSGIVHYSVEGYGEGGTQVLYFDRRGFRNSIDQQRVISGNLIKEKIILLPDSVYEINTRARRFFKSPNTAARDFIEAFRETGSNEAADSLLMIASGGKYEGKEEIAGKMCDKWRLPKANAINWKWKGLILKSEMTLPFGKMTYTVEKMDLDIEVPSMLFDVPRYNYIEKK